MRIYIAPLKCDYSAALPTYIHAHVDTYKKDTYMQKYIQSYKHTKLHEQRASYQNIASLPNHIQVKQK